MSLPNVTNADAVANFALITSYDTLPTEVLNAARFCVTDWFGVALGAANEDAVLAIKRTVSAWRTQGCAPVLLGETMAPAAAALINGTMAHCLDFDDTHVGSLAHLSGPIWAAAYAVGSQTGASPTELLKAFVVGFEVGGRLGAGGFGVAVNERNIHSTGVFGCIGAAVAAGVLHGLDAERLKIAIGLAATQVAGLTGSFGTTAKPFHAGKAAFNGVLAAEMASEGYHGSPNLIEADGGLARALVQDRAFAPAALDFSEGWEITRNTFKPYASCLLTHPSIDAGRELHSTVMQTDIERISVNVDPLCIQLAGIQNPKTPFEAKFSLAFCTALALNGRMPTQEQFSQSSLSDANVRKLVDMVELIPDCSIDKTAARVDVKVKGGENLSCFVPLARGNPGRPMSWNDLSLKFSSLVSPVLCEEAGPAFAATKDFDLGANLVTLSAVVSSQQSNGLTR